MTASRANIERFMALPRVAVVGVSRKEGQYSRIVFEELRKVMAEVEPVNPASSEIGGVPCSPTVAALQPPPDGVILLVHAGAILEIARECIRAGVKMVWLRQSESTSEAHSQAVAECHSAGISVITGECPLMFLRTGHWIHRLHAGLRKITGTYPA
jgi:predicted CoA-binding protein